MRALATNFGWIFGGRTVAALLSVAYLAILTRTLGPAVFGGFALAVAIAQAARSIVGFETWQVVVRYGVAHLGAGAAIRLARLLKAAVLLDAGASLVGVAVTLPLIALIAPRFGWPDDVVGASIGFAFVYMLTMRSTPAGILRLYDRFGVAAVAENILMLARFVGALVVWATSPSLLAYIVAWSVAELASAAVFWAAALKLVRRLPWRAARIDRAALLAENPGLSRFAIVTNAMQIFALAAKQLPVLIVGAFATPSAAGGFRLGGQLGQASAKIAQLASRAIFPELMRTRAFASGPGEFVVLFRRTFQLSLGLGLVLLAILIFAGKPLLILIAGQAFAFAFPVLLILGIAAIVEIVGAGFEPALTAVHRVGAAFRVRIIANLVLVIGLFVLTPRFGAEGAAAAVLAGSLVGFVGMALALRRAMR